MQALTIFNPWAWAISRGLKLIENRTWVPNWRLLKDGEDLAIHSSVRPPTRADFYELARIARECGRENDLEPASSNAFHPAYGQGRVIAVVRLRGIAHSIADVPLEQRPWWRGPKAWLLEEVRQLSIGHLPVVRGQQGLWTLPADVELTTKNILSMPEGSSWRRTA